MKTVGTLEYIFFNQKKYNVEKKFAQTMLTLMTLLLWISPGFGDDKPPDCKARDPAFCSSPCTYLKDKCNGNRMCILDFCSYLYLRLPSRDLERCLDLPSECTDEFKYPTKRGILNKNVAYLLLKLHPFLNQTSQFGFLTSGRFRRITGNFGTEFLGKRSNNKNTGFGPSGGRNQNPPKPKPTPKFYSLPLNKFAKSKVLKRNEETPRKFPDSREKRLSVRGNGRVILGSEFLGKRGFYQNQRSRRLSGTEFLGKRNENLIDGSEFLGKRVAESGAGGDFSEKRQNEPVSGTELLGKKSTQDSSIEFQAKRFGNELLGKRITEKALADMDNRRDFSLKGKAPVFGVWSDYDPELPDGDLPSYESFQNSKIPIGPHFCKENDSGICGRLKVK